EDTNMANIDPFININRGLTGLENYFRGAGTPINKPANIVQGIQGTLNTIRTNYQRIDKDLDNVTQQRDDRDAKIVQLQQDVNGYRQQMPLCRIKLIRLPRSETIGREHGYRLIML